jgi:hypothetical protein
VTTPIDVRAKIPLAPALWLSIVGSIVGDEARWQISGLSGGGSVFLGMDVRAGAVGSVFRITDYRAQIGSATPTLAQPQARQSSTKHAVISP